MRPRRGIFLDFGELESLTQMENRFMQSAPPPMQHGYGPDWGHRGNKHYRKQGFGRLFFPASFRVDARTASTSS